MISSCNGVVSRWQWWRKPKKKKNKKKTITEWKKKRKWCWTEAWVKIERMIIIAAPPPPPPPIRLLFRNSVMINYSWQENEKFARKMLHLFTCTAKNKIHFVADFITVCTKSVGLHVPGNIPLSLTEFYIVSTALTNRNVPFGIWKRPTFHCSDQDIFLRTTICKFPLQCFWSTGQIYDRSPLPPPKKKTTAKNK